MLPHVYRNADIFIMPTENLGNDIEGFGLVYLEAAFYSLPVIASDILGVREAVLAEETGILVAEGSVTEVADAMERLLLHPELRERFGEAGHRRVLEAFTPEKQFGKIKEWLENTI
jgi:phosphatidylinositol alpha-1,6-mannosyltransferase